MSTTTNGRCDSSSVDMEQGSFHAGFQLEVASELQSLCLNGAYEYSADCGSRIPGHRTVDLAQKPGPQATFDSFLTCAAKLSLLALSGAFADAIRTDVQRDAEACN